MQVINNLFNELMTGPSKVAYVVEELLTQGHTVLEVFIC
jgi:hypothetical protein